MKVFHGIFSEGQNKVAKVDVQLYHSAQDNKEKQEETCLSGDERNKRTLTKSSSGQTHATSCYLNERSQHSWLTLMARSFPEN